MAVFGGEMEALAARKWLEAIMGDKRERERDVCVCVCVEREKG